MIEIIDPEYTARIDDDILNIELDNGDWLDIELATFKHLAARVWKLTERADT